MNLQSLIMNLILPALSLAVVLTLIRLVKGPDLPDRVVALDLMAILVIAFIAVYAIATDQPVLLDIASIIALLSFLGAVAFAYYLEKRVG